MPFFGVPFFALLDSAGWIDIRDCPSSPCPKASPIAAAALSLKSLNPALKPAANELNGFFCLSFAGNEPPDVISLEDDMDAEGGLSLGGGSGADSDHPMETEVFLASEPAKEDSAEGCTGGGCTVGLFGRDSSSELAAPSSSSSSSRADEGPMSSWSSSVARAAYALPTESGFFLACSIAILPDASASLGMPGTLARTEPIPTMLAIGLKGDTFSLDSPLAVSNLSTREAGIGDELAVAVPAMSLELT